MTMTNALRALLRCGWMACVLIAIIAMGALAQGNGNNKRTYVTGELLISVPRGTTAPEVDAIASTVKARVVKAFGALDFEKLRETYHLKLDGQPTDNDTLSAINRLKQDARVLYAGPNHLYYPMDAVPSDQKYPLQWHLPMINMPQAWTIEKGQDSVIIAIIDTGCDTSHPDLIARLIPGRNTAGGAPTDLTDPAPHGTHVLGIAGATTDNGQGVAGVTWEKVKMLPIKAGDRSFTETALLGALDFAQTSKATIINMSLGGADVSDTPDLTRPLNSKILAMAKSGVLFSISAGNDGPTSPPINPANMASANENIYCVASVGRQRQIAVYSSVRPYTTIAAPGGDSSTGPTDAILSTLPLNLGGPYGYEEGTSMAAPCFAGVLGLMVSAGGTPADIRKAVTLTADPKGLAVPSPQFGYGIVDAFQAVVQVATTIIITAPEGIGGKASQGGVASIPDPVETLRPTITLRVGNVTPDQLTIKVDDQPVAITVANNVFNVTRTIKDKNNNDVPARYDVVLNAIDFGPGQHKVEVIGNGPGSPPKVVSDVRFFTITPHVIPAGRSMISIPFFQDVQKGSGLPVTPEYYLGGNFRLARYLEGSSYHFYSSFGGGDPVASFNPPDVAPRQDGDSTAKTKAPVGLAFWSDTESAKPILTYGKPLSDRSYIIPLHGIPQGGGAAIAWNMVGDPFNFDVPFNAVLVDTPEGRLTISAAVDRGYLIPNIYSYDGTNGYTFRTLPDGALRAWQGHWVGVTSHADIALVVPPVRATRATATTARSGIGGDGWSMRISASVRNLRDTYNFIGASSRAADAYDRSDVAKPPAVSPFVTLGSVHDDWGNRSGVYAQDIRSSSGVKTYNLVVNTDQPNSTVTVSWDSARALPRSVRAVIKDDTTGQVYNMRTRSGLTFNTGTEPAPRRFTVTTSPATGVATQISNVVLQPASTRAAGTTAISFTLSSDANYEVKVLSATGQSISTVASRAASAGDVRLIWNGKDGTGKSVAAGTYIVQIRATGTDGDSVKVIQPFAVLR